MSLLDAPPEQKSCAVVNEPWHCHAVGETRMNALISDRELVAGCSNSSRRLIDRVLARIDGDPERSGAVFVDIDREGARRSSDAVDKGDWASVRTDHALVGLPFSVKDLFDVAGEVTTAGSVVLADRPPAIGDAGIIAPLRAAGMVLLGRTNMTEFAYSGLGLNPHLGTPRNAHHPERIPGGSSSGAGVAVAHGYSAVAIATDTSGSVRVPAAFNGVVGFKPSRGRYPETGIVPLAPTQDTVGIIAPSVSRCVSVDTVLALADDAPVMPQSPTAARLAIPRGYLLDGLDEATAHAFWRAVTRIRDAGMDVLEADLDGLQLAERIGIGGIVGPEAYTWHEPYLARAADDYDPRVRARIEAAASISRSRYLDCMVQRSEAIGRIDRALASWSALICPTVPMIAPRFDAIGDDAAYAEINRRVLRNTFAFNILDLPAISVPCEAKGEYPVGLMIVGRRGKDRALLALAAALEPLLRDAP